MVRFAIERLGVEVAGGRLPAQSHTSPRANGVMLWRQRRVTDAGTNAGHRGTLRGDSFIQERLGTNAVQIDRKHASNGLAQGSSLAQSRIHVFGVRRSGERADAGLRGHQTRNAHRKDGHRRTE